MINLTPNSIVFNIRGPELSRAIRKALNLSASTSLVVSGLTEIDLGTVTTKTNLPAAFAMFVNKKVLANKRRVFSEAYVESALDGYKKKSRYLPRHQFDELMNADEFGPCSFRSTYAAAIRSGLGYFLIALHSSGAITLPASFPWPQFNINSLGTGNEKRKTVIQLIGSELLILVRSLDTSAEQQPSIFASVGTDRKRREWFLTYASKIILATGWHCAEDVNIEDLLEIKSEERKLKEKQMPLAYKCLIEVLKNAFGDRVKISPKMWSEALRSKHENSVISGTANAVSKAVRHLFSNKSRSDRDLLEEVIKVEPAWGRIDHLRSLGHLSGIDVDFPALAKQWLDLEELYLNKTAKESYKAIKTMFGYWNIYLFFYLPIWFSRNPTTNIKFPLTPNALLKSVFISRLLATAEERPITFVEFFNSVALDKEWANSNHYAYLMQLQKFFEFIERYSDEIKGCKGFTQPLATHDYPPISRPKGSSKQPIPRRLFGMYLDLHEAVLAHFNVVLNHSLSGELSYDDLKVLTRNGTVIDTFATSGLVGFVPVVFTANKTIPLQFIPNVLTLSWRTVNGGRRVYLPHPHGINQNLVALYTGIRHNHIQWLDAETFDSMVDPGDLEFSRLLVNTDKQKKEVWSPAVNIRVVELLRSQKDWLNLIHEPDFGSRHYYNNNDKTKWPKLRPLFAFLSDGRPHYDEIYSDAWRSMLLTLQGLMPDLSEYGPGKTLLRLLPPGFNVTDKNLEMLLVEYGAQFEMGENCPLVVKTKTTPHSARNSVVTQLITFLPADLIGKYFTGQKPGTVNYYVHLEKETLEQAQAYQASRLKAAALRSALEPVLALPARSSTFAHADNVNSSLARGLHKNLGETIISHGVMSIAYSENSKSGVSILLEKKAVGVAFNKTEICPYENNCPPGIVKEIGGFRRCSLCPAAVRAIDHLPAIVAKERHIAAEVDALECILSQTTKVLSEKYTPDELDQLETVRAQFCEELAGWQLAEEILEVTRQRISSGEENRVWVVQKPEIIERALSRVTIATSATEYLFTLLAESITFPVMSNPTVRARFDLLRRELLARSGKLSEAFKSPVPADPAVECAGMLKSIVRSTGKTLSQIIEMLEFDTHMSKLPKSPLKLLAAEEA